MPLDKNMDDTADPSYVAKGRILSFSFTSSSSIALASGNTTRLGRHPGNMAKSTSLLSSSTEYMLAVCAA